MNKWRFYLSAVGVWLAFSIAAFSLGALREGLITPAFGEHVAHVIGTLLFLLVMLAIMCVFIRRVRRTQQRDWWLIGLMWTVMTVCFEFGFFHFVMGIPWEKLLADYNLMKGRVWVLVLATTLFGPPVIHTLLRRRTSEA